MTTIEGNWLVWAKANLECGDALTDDQLKSLQVAYQYEYFNTLNPDLVPQLTEGVTISTSRTLVGLYNKIKCGTVLSETEYRWAQTEVARLMSVYIP